MPMRIEEEEGEGRVQVGARADRAEVEEGRSSSPEELTVTRPIRAIPIDRPIPSTLLTIYHYRLEKGDIRSVPEENATIYPPVQQHRNSQFAKPPTPSRFFSTKLATPPATPPLSDERLAYTPSASQNERFSLLHTLSPYFVFSPFSPFSILQTRSASSLLPASVSLPSFLAFLPHNLIPRWTFPRPCPSPHS